MTQHNGIIQYINLVQSEWHGSVMQTGWIFIVEVPTGKTSPVFITPLNIIMFAVEGAISWLAPVVFTIINLGFMAVTNLNVQLDDSPASCPYLMAS